MFRIFRYTLDLRRMHAIPSGHTLEQVHHIAYGLRRAHHRFRPRRPASRVAGGADRLLKLIVDARDEKLLGVHIVRDLVSNVFNHPTLVECDKPAATRGTSKNTQNLGCPRQ